MRNHLRLLPVGLLAALIVASTVASASANRLSASESGYYVRWAGLEFVTEFGTVTCTVDMTGAFHSRTLNKTRGALIGRITNARIPVGCEGGSLVILTETLPWHITYSSFAGTLPRITGVNWAVTGLKFRYTVGIVSCLFATETTEPYLNIAAVDSTTGVVDGLRADEAAQIDLDDPAFTCDIPGDASFAGTGIITAPPAAGAAVGIHLI